MSQGEKPKEDKPKRINLEELREELTKPVGGMSYERYVHLRTLQAQGELPELEPKELEEYRAFDSSVKNTMGMLKRVNDLSDTKRQRSPSESTRITSDFRIERVNPNEGVELKLEDAIGLLTEQRQQNAQHSEYLAAMLEVLSEIRQARELADRQQKSQDKTNRRLTWAAIIIGAAPLELIDEIQEQFNVVAHLQVMASSLPHDMNAKYFRPGQTKVEIQDANEQMLAEIMEVLEREVHGEAEAGYARLHRVANLMRQDLKIAHGVPRSVMDRVLRRPVTGESPEKQ